MSPYKTIGFIGLGVMGEPICRNLVKRSGAAVLAFDLAPEPLARLSAEGADVAVSVAEIVQQSDLVFLCLPSAKHVRSVFEGDGILTKSERVRLSSISAPRRSSKPAILRDNCRSGAPPGPTRQSRVRARLRRTERSASWSVRRRNYSARSSP
jgi:hypothetical protein